VISTLPARTVQAVLPCDNRGGLASREMQRDRQRVRFKVFAIAEALCAERGGLIFAPFASVAFDKAKAEAEARTSHSRRSLGEGGSAEQLFDAVDQAAYQKRFHEVLYVVLV
jgi:hypothetical protein